MTIPLDRLPLAARVTAVALAAYVPVLVSVRAGGAVGWLVGAVIALGLIALPRLFDEEALACALLPAAALTFSGLVTASSEYLGLAVVGLALGGRHLLEHRDRPAEALRSPVPWAVLGLVVAYLAWAALSTLASTEHRTSLVYLVGMAFALGIAFWVVPAVLATPDARWHLLATLVAVALVAVAVTVLLSIIGPPTVYGQSFGSVLMIEPTLWKTPTGLVFPRAFGPYIDPGPYYTLLAFGLIAALALRDRAPLPAAAAAVVLTVALLASFSRSGWLMAITGAAAWGAVSVWRRRPDVLGLGIGGVIALALVALLVNVLGADARFDVQMGRGWPAYVISGTLTSAQDLQLNGSRSQVRGGAALNERGVLWEVSVAAARKRPLLGHGPGTDADAIAPFLSRDYVIYRGISSHSTWLRTLVEMGLPGLALLALLWLLVGVLAAGALARSQAMRDDPVFVALVALGCAALPDQFFEIYLFGGLSLPNVLVPIAMALVATQAGPVVRAALGRRSVPAPGARAVAR